MTKLCLILGDQLSSSISSLRECAIGKDIILLCEVWEEATYVKHHKKKIAFIFSAMRHFAAELEKKGHRVIYRQLSAPDNAGSFAKEIARVLEIYPINHLVVTEPGEYRLLKNMHTWQEIFGVTVEIREDDRFLCSKKQFAAWAKEKKQLRMEYFYREMRKQTNVLMEDNHPLGGQWNFDADNRKPAAKGTIVPQPFQQPPDKITQEVLSLVEKQFPNHFGDAEPFYYAVTREQALQALDLFIRERLPLYGDYQDAMLQDEPWMYHGHISFYLNCGLLLPQECIEAAELAYNEGHAPLNSVEGFVRQIIGWREYVRGVYWLKMPAYRDANFFEAQRNLPDFYWTGQTSMNCIKQCVETTKQHAYAHHIQRLMVLGNFALLAGIHPAAVNEWFLIVYADAYEWVELPNVTGMILFADGGYLASKPYAAGGSYINKMSDYCKSCRYKVSQKTGPDACPFNYLYWDFLVRQRPRLADNHRLAMMYKTYDRMDQSKKQAIANDSKAFLEALE